ncbi:MAG: nuclear transport factor 2 family protein [Maribacter sp.]|uniref:nuclear transport factor 2 family protein n=1 Tax=Maribacter sp. TaxID=1897614 RepID=UPI0032976B13
MRNLILSILMASTLFGCKPDSVSKQGVQNEHSNLTPLEVVNKRMALYNQHNFAEFIRLYADDVKIYTYPDKLLGTGADNITSIFKPKFAERSIQVEIVSQMHNGNFVINHEIVTENGSNTKYVSIYEVRDGLIRSVKFVRDN